MATQNYDHACAFLQDHANDALRNPSRADVPEDMVAPLVCYLVYGRGGFLGGFLTALVAGDFYRAATNADSDNFPALGAFGRWIAFTWPTAAYGSYEKLDAWEGLEANAKRLRELEAEADSDDGLDPLRDLMPKVDR